MFGLTAFSQSPFSALGGTVYSRSISESVAPADSIVGVLVQASAIAESVAAADTQNLAQVLGAAISESMAPADTQVPTQIRVATYAESMAVTDAQEQLTGKFVFMAESVAASDAYTLSNNTFNAVVPETMNAGDTVSSTGLILFEEVDETVGIAESIAVAQALVAAISESIASLDAYAKTSILPVNISEETHPEPVINAANNANSAVSESVATSDAFTGQRVYNYFISESVSAADAQTGVFNFTTTVAETLAAADNMTYTVDTRALPTGILITISVNNVNVWGPIDDDSNPNWVVINDQEQ